MPVGSRCKPLKTSAAAKTWFSDMAERSFASCAGTNQQKALDVAERIRLNIASMRIHNGTWSLLSPSVLALRRCHAYVKSDETLIHDAMRLSIAQSKKDASGRNRAD